MIERVLEMVVPDHLWPAAQPFLRYVRQELYASGVTSRCTRSRDGLVRLTLRGDASTIEETLKDTGLAALEQAAEGVREDGWLREAMESVRTRLDFLKQRIAERAQLPPDWLS